MVLKLVDDEAESPDEMEVLIHEFKAASDALEDAKRSKDYWQRRLDEKLVAVEHKAATVPYKKEPDKDLRAVRVSNRRFSIDSAGLIKKYGVRKIKKLLKDPEVDKAKLDAALSEADESFAKDEVAQYITVTDNPYVRLYIVNRKEEEADDDQPER